jgi:hypothetical protein
MLNNPPQLPPLSDEDRAAYLKYVTPTRGTPEEIAAAVARWTDARIQMAIAMNL